MAAILNIIACNLGSIFVCFGFQTYMGLDKYVTILVGLHTEMAASRTIGDILDGSGWTDALTQADIATAGTCEGFLRASYVTKTRRAHQVTAAALYQ